MRVPALVISCVLAAGCVTTKQTVEPQPLGQPSAFSQLLQELAGANPGLARHDPQNGEPLFQQIPAWDGAAMKRCCSVLNAQEFRKMRCDTDQPLGGRTNRC